MATASRTWLFSTSAPLGGDLDDRETRAVSTEAKQRAKRWRAGATLAAGGILALAAAGLLLPGGLSTVRALVHAAPAPIVFNNAPSIALPAQCVAMSPFAEGDVTGDGKPDLVMFCGPSLQQPLQIVTLRGNGDGTFSSAPIQTLLTSNPFNGAEPVALADVDGDGKLDLVTDDLSCNIDVFLGNGDGTFSTTPVQIPEPDYCGNISEPFVVVANPDLSGSGKPDLILENIYGGGIPNLTVFLNTSTVGKVGFVNNDVTVAFSLQDSITGLAVGNFTGQTVPDLAVGITNFGSSVTANSVEILKNNGSGTAFAIQSTLPLPATASTQGLSGIAAGDFNGDGKVDLAAVDLGDNAIFVLYGDGAGNLSVCNQSILQCQNSAGQTIAGLAPAATSNLTTGKFNGLPGLSFDNTNDGFSVLLSTGNGLQSTPQNYVAGPFESEAAIGDLNGDGFADAIVTTQNGLSVFLNNGGGILEGTQAFPAGTGPQKISLLRNFFGNSEQDVAVALNVGSAIAVLGSPAGGPNGTLPQSFGPIPFSTSSTASVTALTSGCLDNSSPCAIPFVAAATYDTTTSIAAAYIIYITPSGPSKPTNIFTALPSQPVTDMAAGDFNGDGKTDLAFTIGSAVEVFTGNGDGTFSVSPQTFSAGANPIALAVADFNGDGKPDIAVLDQSGGALGLFQNTSSSSSVNFQPVAIYPLPSSSVPAVGMTVGDFNNDGFPDIAVSSASAVTIFLNNGDGTLGSPSTFPVSGTGANGPIAAGDFNGDGNVDLAVLTVGCCSDSVLILPGDGAGGFSSPPQTFAVGAFPAALAVADFNGDGKPDIAIADSVRNMVTLLLNGTAASTAPPPSSADLSIAAAASPNPIAVSSILTYTFTVTNNGPSNATGVALTDTLPSGTSFQSASPSQGTCANSSGTVTCSIGSLANGATATITLAVTTPVTATSSLSDTASVSGNETDPNPTNNTATTAVNVTLPVNLSITKTAPATGTTNQNLTYTITVTNASTATSATNVTVTDPLASGVNFQSDSPSQGSCTNPAVGTQGLVSCNLGTVASGGAATISLVVQPTQVNSALANTATVTADQANSNPSNSATATVNVQASGAAKVNVLEPIHVTDTPLPLGAAMVPVSEPIHVTDTPLPLGAAMVPVSEPIHVTDTPLPLGAAMVPVSEPIHVTDIPGPSVLLAKLVTSLQSVAPVSGGYSVTFLVQNIGTAAANNVRVTASSLYTVVGGTVQPTTTLPNLGTIQPGAQVSVTLAFSAAYPSGTMALLRIAVTYAGGSAGGTSRTALP